MNTHMSKKEKRELKKERRAEKKMNAQKEASSKKTGWMLGVIGVIAAVVVGVMAVAPEPIEIPEDASVVQADDHVKGNPNATVTLIEYSDFQCPACSSYAPVLKRLSNEFPEKLRIVYRHYPLKSIHPVATPAAVATEAAAQQGKFWEMHDKLFEKQHEWSKAQNARDLFISYAKDLELDEEAFTTALDDKALLRRVVRDEKTAQSLRLTSTPSFFLDGTKISNPKSYEDFKKMIEAAITISGSSTPTTEEGDDKKKTVSTTSTPTSKSS